LAGNGKWVNYFYQVESSDKPVNKNELSQYGC